MKKNVPGFIALWLLVLFAAGCDDIVRENPVNLDTSGSFEFSIETTGNSYDQTIRANLEAIVSTLDFSSGDINLYNITIKAINTGSTPDDVSVSGELSMSRAGSGMAEPLAGYSEVELSQFATERSLFTDEFEGIEPHSDGLQSVVQMFNENPLPTVDFSVNGVINRPEDAPQMVTLDIIVTVYIQVIEEL